MNKMKLLDFYTSILKAAGMVVTSDGYISMKLGAEPTPALVGGKRLVLPTKEHLANPNSKERVAFHPLSENILRKESEVLETFRKALNLRLNFVLGIVSAALLRLATSPAEHKDLTPEQSEFLSAVKDADEKTIGILGKIVASCPAHQSFVSIYLMKGGTLNGRTHQRVGRVTFPIYQELLKGDSAFGVKLRVKDRAALKGLLEYMIPQIDVKDAYSRGSDAPIAPFLDALLKVVAAVGSPLNDRIELFRKQIHEPDDLLMEDEWVPILDDISVMSSELRMVPTQPGNEGRSVKEKDHHEEQPAAGAPAFAATPAAATSQVVAQPAPTIPAWQQVYNQQHQPQYNMPVMNMQPQAHLVHTGRGLDFTSLMQTNPAFALQRNMVPGATPGGYIPRYAQPQMGMQPAYGQQQFYPSRSGF